MISQKWKKQDTIPGNFSRASPDQAPQLPWPETTFPRSQFVCGARPSRRRGPWETKGRGGELPWREGPPASRGCLTPAPRNGSQAGRGARGRAPEGGRRAGRGGQAHSVPLDALLQLSKERTPRLMPDKGSMYYPRVQHYRELLDSLPMDAYTHGCILHPELTVDSMIPAYATTRIRSQIGNTESELKKLAEENPDLQEAYIAKQKRLKSKLLDHDNVKYLKKILDELEKVLDQVETELQRRNEETPEEGHQPWLCGESFTLADVSLAVTLHRLKFLGFARRNWGNGKRPNLETYYERVLKRKTFNKVLGHVNNILISAVLPTAFRVAKKRAPKVLGTTLVVGLLAGMGYFAFMLFRRRLGSMILALRPRPNYF
ncbi:ganglioside-induced differentiation-associated protein 1 isoform X1 [Peromyscus maniculatus bairdii]|uniref:ganglioside-induced differentiation-associated protein 1 isoform X1 n=1 Tax=Peromyscus maniculatus bairdii TaxID=230844 RepID=UPI003FD55F60